MAESQEVQIERLSGKVSQIERDAERRDRGYNAVRTDLSAVHRALEDLRRDFAAQASIAATAKAAADKANADLAARREDEEADARLRAKVAKYLQFGVGVLILLFSMWSGTVKSTLDHIAQFFRDVR
jgi:hypothetical protein